MTWMQALITFNQTLNFGAEGEVATYDPEVNKAEPGLMLVGTETGAIYTEVREVGGDLWMVQNATFDGTNWVPKNLTLPVYGSHFKNNGTFERVTCAAGTNPIAWTSIFSVDAAGNITSASTGNQRNGSEASVVADGSVGTLVTYSTPFPAQTNQVIVTINNDPTNNPWDLGVSVTNKTKNGFTVWVYNGPPGAAVSIDYLAFGS